MTSTRRDLEAALAAWVERPRDAEWRDTLAIYADHLLAEGDPRGELIALDLQIDAHGTTTELVARRASLLASFLGHLRPLDNPHLPWVGDSLSHGFVDDLVIDADDPSACERLVAILGSPIGPYLRRIAIRGGDAFLERALGILARREHAWLEQLALVKWAWSDVPASDATAARAIAAMPRLRACPTCVRACNARALLGAYSRSWNGGAALEITLQHGEGQGRFAARSALDGVLLGLSEPKLTPAKHQLITSRRRYVSNELRLGDLE